MEDQGDSINRRRGGRRTTNPEHSFAYLHLTNRKIPVLIMNEAVGGIGVVAVNAPEMDVGSCVQLESFTRRQETRVASVRYVNFSDATICRIGLEWTD